MSRLRPVAAAALAALCLAATSIPHQAQATSWQPLEQTSGPREGNPLKGFLPYASVDHTKAAGKNLDYTMEWFYLPLNAVVTGENTYDWTKLEEQLNAIAGRNHQAVLRFYLDHPKLPTGVPDYLLGENGIKQNAYDDYGNDFLSFSPDYNDPRVKALMQNFIAEFGKKYDGDPRIGFITTGLMGFWGEQHTVAEARELPDGSFGQPVDEDGKPLYQWMPDYELEIYQDWDAAFDTTKFLNRSPEEGLENTAVGFHDDSFPVETYEGESWYFLEQLKSNNLTTRWETEPIGGEVRPEVQGCIFDTSSCSTDTKKSFKDLAKPNIFALAAADTHVSWLINNYAFETGYSGESQTAAAAAHNAMGYDLAVSDVRVDQSGNNNQVSVKITNRGNAPFYYDWPLEFSLLDSSGNAVDTASVTADLPSIGKNETIEVSATLTGDEGTLALRVPNPMPGGKALRFANVAEDADFTGYLTLGKITPQGGSSFGSS